MYFNVFFTIILYHFIHQCTSYVIIYNTENQVTTQSYDCLLYSNKIYHLQSSKYCIRTNVSIELKRTMNNDSECLNNGQKYNFYSLKMLNIEPMEILKWNSGIELADLYAAYLNRFDHESDYGKHHFLCNCTKIGTFGKFCEYNFMSNSTFEETIEHQFYLKSEHYFGSQYIGNRTCYTSLECNYGLLCLDWRNICDGKQQCIDGLDEDNCELLEYNECHSNEYRCSNGQCIDEEFFLDGDIDCMDRSDEQYKILQLSHIVFIHCAFKPDFNCDEVLVPRNQFSCGDGQFHRDSYLLYREKSNDVYCASFRSSNFKCELDKYQPLWTMNNGQCVIYGRLEGNSTKDICLFLIKCALHNGLGLGCPCNGQNCTNTILHYNCTSDNGFIEYPLGGVLALNVRTFYMLENLYGNEQPTNISFTGSVKCIGFQVSLKEVKSMDYDAKKFAGTSDWRSFELLLCETSNRSWSIRNSSGPQYDINCWNNIYKSYKCPISHRCISMYRIGDGIIDCEVGDDEPYLFQNATFAPVNCSSIEKHRFRCSKEEPSCLLSTHIGDFEQQCFTNNRDEYSVEMQLKLSNYVCTNRDSFECTLIKQYIEQSSSINVTNDNSNINLTFFSSKSMPFSQYCDTFWDLKFGFDETSFLCKEWICPSNYYQCLNGQCIPLEWICDGEWDCSDASDEEGLLSISKLSQHNSKIINLFEMILKCALEYRTQPFSQLCKISEYPCLLANVTDPFNFTENPPCIPMEKIGDGISDCYGGLDERNIRSCNSGRMLGFNFECLTDEYGNYPGGNCIPYHDLCDHRCLNGEDKILCFYLKNNSKIRCDGSPVDQFGSYTDVHCLNGTCIPNARCNDIPECSFGEDEYYCNRRHAMFVHYRSNKIRHVNNIYQTINLRNYPEEIDQFIRDKNDYKDKFSLLRTSSDLSFIFHKIESNKISSSFQINTSADNTYKYFDENNNNSLYYRTEQHLIAQSIEPWTCNRGIAIKKQIDKSFDTAIECFCPPSYFGRFCQYFSDRITIITYLNGLKYIYKDDQQLLKNTIKILVTLIYNESIIIDYNEIHFTPILNDLNEKRKFYLIYPRPKVLSRDQFHKIRFEAFELNMNSSIRFLSIWEYLIEFNFLPSFRIAKILKFQENNYICQKNPCQNNSTCYHIMNLNDSRKYFCFCSKNFYGKHCEYYDNSSCSICSSNSLCRSHYHFTNQSLCLCSINRFGSTCHLERKCDMFNNKNPCLNKGLCFVRYNHDNSIEDYICICPSMYFGDHCQYSSAKLTIQYVINDINLYSSLASVVQLYNYDYQTLDLILEKQQVYPNQPMYSNIIYAGQILPIFGFLKVYYHDQQYSMKLNTKYFLLYIRKDETNLTLTISLHLNNSCPHTHRLFFSNISQIEDMNEVNISTIVFKYHNLCQNTKFSFLCFHDDNYLCLCDRNNRAECFRYNHTIDSCRHCLLNSPCIQGDRNIESDFLCLCSECYFGSICQHNTRLLSFTLESLFANDIISNSNLIQKLFIIIYILLLIIVFFFGLFNNLCCFVTFRRPKPRQVGVGHYLFVNSITSQISLLLLFIKMIHFLLSSKGLIINYTINMILCKSITFLLTCFTRICIWLTTFVSIERTYVTLYPGHIWIKKPKIARITILFTILFLIGLHIHELIYYNVVPDPKYTKNGAWCVTQYNKQLSIYNQTITIFNYIIPCLINFLSALLLILVVARKRANTNQKLSFMKILRHKFQEYKELFIPPIFIIFSALPQFIISFSLACTQFLDIPWQRYLVITSYFLSYLPQMTNYIIFILPSVLYKNELDRTVLGHILKNFKQKFCILFNKKIMTVLF
ncbi:unnamed protein product [Adineta steineri]|uniref:Uncharacterized protein n=1 Tax=Adineta steineri TaxID=433720 RepID=A0A819CLH6_9BILA|nr:unnamed protein product [Adineta steineri]